MKLLKNRIDFCVVLSVDGANPNGNPLSDNRPRTDYDGFGEISDVCIKRKIRNRLQDMGEEIFVKSDDRNTDGHRSLSSRIMAFEPFKIEYKKKDPDPDIIKSVTCDKWIDVRAFGQVFPFKGLSASTSVRGCVSVGMAKSLSEVTVRPVQIIKGVNLEDTVGGKKDNTTMACKYVVSKAAYAFYGSIFPQLAELNHFTVEDADKMHFALKTLFECDASSARPAGTMNVQQVYWWEHNCPNGQYPQIKVFRSFHLEPQDEYPFYSVTRDSIPDLAPEIYTL